jgi:Glycosyl transferase family 8
MNGRPNTSQPIKIFIGSSPNNIIEEKVFRYTLQKYTFSPIEIHIIDGKAGSVKNINSGETKKLPTHLIHRIKGATAFSLARWAIPQWCGYQGKAIYCDSDQIALRDISGLWNYDLCGNPLAAVSTKKATCFKHYRDNFLKFYLNSDDDFYLASVMLFDCEKACWSFESLIDLLDEGKFSLSDLMYLGKGFRSYLKSNIGELPNEWNHLDVANADSKIVHFTDLTSQPWLFHHNPASSIWEKFFLESIDQDFLSKEEIVEAYSNKWISKRIMALAFMNEEFRRPINSIWRNWNAFVFLFLRFCQHFTGFNFWQRLGGKLKSLLSKIKYASVVVRG